MKTSIRVIVAIILGIPPSVSAQEPPNDPKTIGRIFHSMFWTGKEVLVWGGGSEGMFFGHGLRIDPAAKGRTVMAEKGAPSGRWGHAGVWTGTEMIVWGGRSQFESDSHHADGARYDPRTDTWKPMSAVKAPDARSQMAAVWTGEEMLVWGGFGNGAVAWNTGGRYNPKTDTWKPISATGAPEARVEPLSVWTGKEFLVWGGITPDLKRTFRSGARYDPATDKWTPMKSEDTAPAVWGGRAVWTGSEMLVWGGSHRNGDDEINEVIRSGGAYDPVKNRWRTLKLDGAPAARFFHDAVWTGTRLVVWGGGDQGDDKNPAKHYDDGGEYDPVKDRWGPLAWEKPPAARGMHSAVWTGRGMMIFGGSTGGFSAFSDAALWEPR
jgi:N-acetylneuraminic acid mutarotase